MIRPMTYVEKMAEAEKMWNKYCEDFANITVSYGYAHPVKAVNPAYHDDYVLGYATVSLMGAKIDTETGKVIFGY